MKFLSTCTALLFATIASADVMSMDWQHAGTCGQKNPNVNAAIDHFCGNGNIVVPSNYALGGAQVGNMLVRITGNCGYQWVPSTWCTAQFHAVCAKGGPRGGGHKVFNGCQNFEIIHLVDY